MASIIKDLVSYNYIPLHTSPMYIVCFPTLWTDRWVIVIIRGLRLTSWFYHLYHDLITFITMRAAIAGSHVLYVSVFLYLFGYNWRPYHVGAATTINFVIYDECEGLFIYGKCQTIIGSPKPWWMLAHLVGYIWSYPHTYVCGRIHTHIMHLIRFVYLIISICSVFAIRHLKNFTY